MIVLTPFKKSQYPIIAQCINPDVFQEKSKEEIGNLPVWIGNKKRRLVDLFKVEKNSANSTSITINGDVTQVRRIGWGMTQGEIVVNGNVGMHLGKKMSGGKIVVNGNAEGWAGSEMKGGLIEIKGDAGDYLGSPYRGSTVGMRKGKIVVDGNVGSDAAVFMKSGTIRIRGNAGPFIGFRMTGGVIHIEKNAGTRLGACMIGGKIVVSGRLENIMPTFAIERLKGKVKIEPGDKAVGPFYVFLGDLAENGRGKLFVSKEKNPQLSQYERFL
ncbi:MAG: formylmethanofuran dehydrogenase subunit C [Candidatus Bathyarchaeota archaeon]|nr:formylmethanofuran dehydrogenase subunit C [Candidatus Bathyarchaeota archaeon]